MDSFAPSNSFRDLYRTKYPHHTKHLDDTGVDEVAEPQIYTGTDKSRGTIVPTCSSAWNDLLAHAQEHVVWTDNQGGEQVGWKIGYRRFFSLTTATPAASNDSLPTWTHYSRLKRLAGSDELRFTF
jgi:hypothetical protein